MADYLTRTFSRVLNQLLLLFGGIVLLAFLLSVVAGQIRGAGSSVLGRGYYYVVAPGVVCHESGHALGCLLTGKRIVQFRPFRPYNHECASLVAIRESDEPWWKIGDFLVASGPVWLGCLVIWLLTRLLSRSCALPSFDVYFPLDPFPSSPTYWGGVLKASAYMFKTAFKIWDWRSTLNVVYMYLVFCIASEMGISRQDLMEMWYGFAFIAALFLLLNIVPAVGNAVGARVFRLCRVLFPIHVLMAFVLIVDALFMILLVWPLELFR